MLGDILGGVNSYTNRLFANKLPFAQRIPDQGANYMVYNLQQQKGIPKDQDGRRVNEWEDPTYLGFDLEIIRDDSPVFTQLWCFLDKYKYHPEMRDRMDLYALYLNCLNYFIKSGHIGQIDEGTETSNTTIIPNSADNGDISKNPKKQDNKQTFARQKDSTTLDPLSLGVVWGPLSGEAAQVMSTPKKHYVVNIKEMMFDKAAPFDGSSWKPESNKFSIEVREDIILWTKLFTYVHNNLVYSYKNHRKIIPDNMMEFTLRIKVSEIRHFDKVREAIEQLNDVLQGDLKELIANPVIARARQHWGMMDQIRSKEEDAVRMLTHCYSFYRYHTYGTKFEFPMEFNKASAVSNEEVPKPVGNTTLKMSFKKFSEEMVSEMVPKFLMTNQEVMHLDNAGYEGFNKIGTGSTRIGDSADRAEDLFRPYYTGNPQSQGVFGSLKSPDKGLERLYGKPSGTGLEQNLPGLAGFKEKVAETIVKQKDAALKGVVNDLRKGLNQVPFNPSNVYYPGSLLGDALRTIQTNVSEDIFEVFFGKRG
jgi:hypothetical protein